MWLLLSGRNSGTARLAREAHLASKRRAIWPLTIPPGPYRSMNLRPVGQAFRPAGSGGFPAPSSSDGLESPPNRQPGKAALPSSWLVSRAGRHKGLSMNLSPVGQAFRPAGSGGFPAPSSSDGLESPSNRQPEKAALPSSWLMSRAGRHKRLPINQRAAGILPAERALGPADKMPAARWFMVSWAFDIGCQGFPGSRFRDVQRSIRAFAERFRAVRQSAERFSGGFRHVAKSHRQFPNSFGDVH